MRIGNKSEFVLRPNGDFETTGCQPLPFNAQKQSASGRKLKKESSFQSLSTISTTISGQKNTLTMWEWTLTDINSTTFNTLSTLTATVTAQLLMLVLGLVYARMIWWSVKRGNGVDLDIAVAPPTSVPDAVRRFFLGGSSSRLLVLAVSVFAIVATYSQTAANNFLEFVDADVGSNQVSVFQPTGTAAKY
jgi:hypothetical protein